MLYEHCNLRFSQRLGLELEPSILFSPGLFYCSIYSSPVNFDSGLASFADFLDHVYRVGPGCGHVNDVIQPAYWPWLDTLTSLLWEQEQESNVQQFLPN